VLDIKYMVSDPALLHSYPTTDSNTSTGIIRVTLKMPSAAEECRESSGNFTLYGEWSPVSGCFRENVHIFTTEFSGCNLCTATVT